MGLAGGAAAEEPLLLGRLLRLQLGPHALRLHPRQVQHLPAGGGSGAQEPEKSSSIVQGAGAPYGSLAFGKQTPSSLLHPLT